MADIRDFARFIRTRWDWTRFGYERGFPRGCQFTDQDAATEFNGHALVIEAKSLDPSTLAAGECPELPQTGQRLYLEDEVRRGKAALVVYGCGVCNDPYAVYDIGRKEWFIWRDEETGEWFTQKERRIRLKRHINRAMGIKVES